MGKKAKGGGFVAGGKGGFKALVDLGLEECSGDVDFGGGSSRDLASPARRRVDLVVGDDARCLEVALAGGEAGLGGFDGGLGSNSLVQPVLGGGEEEWPLLPVVEGGAGAVQSPEVVESGGRVLRSGRIYGGPAAKAKGVCLDMAGEEGLLGAGLGGPTPALVVAGGVAGGGGGKVGRGSVLGVAPAAGVLGGGPAGGEMAGMFEMCGKGFWEEVAGGFEVQSGDLCSGQVVVVGGKLRAFRRWVDVGVCGRPLLDGGGVVKLGGGVVGCEVVAGGCEGAAGELVVAGAAGPAGEVVVAGRVVEVGDGGGVGGVGGGEEGGEVPLVACTPSVCAYAPSTPPCPGSLAGGSVGEAGGLVVAGDAGVAGGVVVAGRLEEVGGDGGVGGEEGGKEGGEVPLVVCTPSVCANAPSTPPCPCPLAEPVLLVVPGCLPADPGQHSGAASGAAVAAACVGDGLQGGCQPLVARAQARGPTPSAWTVKKCRRIVSEEARADYVASDGVTVQLDADDAAACVTRLGRALVGRVLGRVLPFGVLCRELKRMWSKFGDFQISSLGSSCFVCFFSSQEVRDLVLMGGPWFAEGHLVGVDRWSPGFDPESFVGLSAPIWVRFPGLPLHFWGERNLAQISSMLGTPLWVDEVTATWGRTAFARVCVRVGLSDSLPTGVWVEDSERRFFQPVIFEGLDRLCFRCGRAGHSRDECGMPAKAASSSSVRSDAPGPSGPSVAPQPPVGIPVGSSAAAVAAIPAIGSSILEGQAAAPDGGDWQRVERRRVRFPPQFFGRDQFGGRGAFFGRPDGRPPAGSSGQRMAPRLAHQDVRASELSGSPPRGSGQITVGGPSRLEKGKQIVTPAPLTRAPSSFFDVGCPAEKETDDSLALVLFGHPVRPAVAEMGGGFSSLVLGSDSGGGAPPQPG